MNSTEKYEMVTEKQIKTIRPGVDRILIEPEMLKSKANLIIPSDIKARHQATMGKILAIGELSGQFPFPFNIGDRVMFSRYCGQEIVHSDGEDEVSNRILHVSEVLAAIDVIDKPDGVAHA